MSILKTCGDTPSAISSPELESGASPCAEPDGLTTDQCGPEAACTPLRRDLAEQLAGQPTDAMRELSSILARHTEKCWGEACREKAGAASSPLIHGATSRVGRLRAYGNAVNAKAAEIFIRSYARPAKHHENPMSD